MASRSSCWAGRWANFSAFPEIMERSWSRFKAMNLNTVEYPVYWNVIEPEEGKFDFRGFDQILRRTLAGLARRSAVVWDLEERRHGLDSRLGQVGHQALPPRAGFRRQAHSLAFPHVEEQPGADEKAYSAMIRRLRESDDADRAVI